MRIRQFHPEARISQQMMSYKQISIFIQKLYNFSVFFDLFLDPRVRGSFPGILGVPKYIFILKKEIFRLLLYKLIAHIGGKY